MRRLASSTSPLPVLRLGVTASLTAILSCTGSASGQATDAAASPRASTAASKIDPALFKGLSYRLVGPSRGGRATTVTGVPGNDRTFYMGVASGGVFRTTNGGASWEPITDGKIPLGSIGSIAVADSNPKVIYVGTGSDGVRSNVSTGRGVYKTTDGGETWEFAGLYKVGQIGAVRIHPTDPNTVWVAANGDVFKSNKERGVYKTTDGGKTWGQVLAISDKTGAMDVELQPFDPNVVYAWMSHVERKPWTIISGSTEGGFFKSTDGGESWHQKSTGLPNELIGKGNLGVTAADPKRIYALIEAKPGGGLYRSDDAGESWKQVNDQGSLIQRPFYYTTLGCDPTDADVVYAGAEGFYKSTDGGRTMQRMRTPHGDNHDIWVSPANGDTMVQCNDGGANVSYDGGRTWSTQSNQPTSEIYGVWVDNGFPYKLYGAQQDNSTIIISSLANPSSTDDWRSGPGCETGPIIPHPTNPNIVYGSCKGKYEWMNMRTGLRKAYWIGAESLYGSPPRELKYRIQRTAPMEVSVNDPDRLYYGTQYVHRTTDRGVTWHRISPDLTWNPKDRQEPSGGPITRDATGEEIYSTLYQIRESVLDGDVIWVGANDGPFHVTRDGGKTWKNVTPAGLEPGGRVQIIEPSPHRLGSAYYATHRYLLGDYRPYIYRTDDYGATWTLLTDGKNGIPADWPTRVIREDPDREGLLYAGTEFGMFISFDNGGSWQDFRLNTAHVPITDIKVHRKDLVVSTQGRAFWILDNISSLHQVQADSSPDRVKLYKPRDGYRTTLGGGRLGPMIEYHLPKDTLGPVILEILDAAGAVVSAHDSSRAPRAQPGRRPGAGDPMMEGRGARGGQGARGQGGRGQGGRGGQAGQGRGQGAGGQGRGQRGGRGTQGAPAQGRGQRGGGFQRRGRGRGGRVARVTVNEGINRFAWNYRHTDGRALPPGRYIARLKVGSTTQTQSFALLLDPRLVEDGVTAADLVEQFHFAKKLTELTSDTNALVTRVRRAQRDGDSAVADAAKALADELLTESIRYGVPGLQAQVRYLSGVSRSSEQKLGGDAKERYAELRKRVDALIAAANQSLGKK